MGSVRPIYFDYNATTPLDSGVREAMRPLLEELFGNPSSIHAVGRQSRALLDDCRDRAAESLGAKPGEIVFTSGGTESNNFAIIGMARRLSSKGRHLITSQIEHHAVLHPIDWLERHGGFSTTRLPPDSEGRIDPGDLLRAIRPDTVLVSIQAANNEIGTIQPVAELARVCRERGVIFHTDAVQWAGKLPLTSIKELGADLISLCAHKIHGPKGAGLLYVRSPLQPEPLLWGGGHEHDRRAGTENLAGIAGLASAVERFVREPVFPPERLRGLTASLEEAVDDLAGEGVVLRSPRLGRLPNTVAFTVERADAISLLAALDLEGVCASSGAACSAGSLEPSHVVLALGAGEGAARALVRLSLGRESTADEVSRVQGLLPGLIRRVQTPR